MSAVPDVFAGRLNASRVGVLDGGFATFMEDELGLDMPSPLWSATLLDPNHRQGQWHGHDAVRAAHAAFIKAGSRIVETASYQASVPSFARSQPPNPTYPPSAAEHLMRESIRLAAEAADSARSDSAPDAIVALSLGPYGAMLEGGREYTGLYAPADKTGDPQAEAQVRADIFKFHLDRLLALSADGQLWSRLGLLAFETIPRLDEAEEIVSVLAALDKDLTQRGISHRPPALLSFVFPNLPSQSTTEGAEDHHAHLDVDVFLPYPPTGPKPTAAEIVRAVRPLPGSSWPLIGLGVNCTKPHFIQSIVRDIAGALNSQGEKTWATPSGAPALFVYPDGGLTWDGIARVWRSDARGEHKSAAPHSGDEHGHSEEEAWAKNLVSAVLHNPAFASSGNQHPFDSIWLGGCCKSGCGHISELAKLVYA